MVGRGGGPPPQQEHNGANIDALLQAMTAQTAAMTALLVQLPQQGGGNNVAQNARSYLQKRSFVGQNMFVTFEPEDKNSNSNLVLQNTTHELLSNFLIFIQDAHNGIAPEISTIILELKYVLSPKMRERWATHEVGHPITNAHKQHFLAVNNGISFQTWFDEVFKTQEMQKNAHKAFHNLTMKQSGTPAKFYKDLLQLRTACLNNEKLHSVNLTDVYKAFYNGLGTIFQATISDYHSIFVESSQTEMDLLKFATSCEPKWEAHLSQHPMDAPERVFTVMTLLCLNNVTSFGFYRTRY